MDFAVYRHIYVGADGSWTADLGSGQSDTAGGDVAYLAGYWDLGGCEETGEVAHNSNNIRRSVNKGSEDTLVGRLALSI